ncbi:DNA replication complex GINS protein SLD5-like [Paramacrobiotus metropolitanus]|uniref:DNA replication complex GINS protein SLD5-like n=1 Tax=Paramacrobiotus metropolitanus TaxID=2943436 RepID=UPI002445ED04|nr:DNA replication complex GINS protein SLD5-like [Paramacrobiotus metropolitanus]XP_055331323.1 DNA replication complex GINS protein SLD5-like [Paramacrobiotus metropolitanus]
MADFDATLEDVLAGAAQGGVNDSTAVSMSDLVNSFKDIWRNERYAPELLPEKMYVVDCLLDQIKQKEADASALQQGAAGTVDRDACTLIRLECSRIRFMISNYLRCRLAKIEDFCMYLKQLPANEQSVRLSRPEMVYLYGLVEKIEEHLKSSIGLFLPPGIGVLDDRSGWYKTPTRPKMDMFIIAKPREELAQVRLDDRVLPGRVEHEDLQAGGQYLLRYTSIRDYIFTDDEHILKAKAILM